MDHDVVGEVGDDPLGVVRVPCVEPLLCVRRASSGCIMPRTVRRKSVVGRGAVRQAGPMGDLANDTAVRARGDGLLRSDAQRRLGDLGTDGRLRGGLRVPRAAVRRPQISGPPRSRATSSASPRSAPSTSTSRRASSGRTATAQRVEITQDDRPILDAMVWSVGDVEGLEHDETIMPDVPGPDRPSRHPRLVARRRRSRRSRSGTTSTRGRSHFEVDWPPDGPRPRAGRSGCASCRPRPSTTRGSTRAAR